MLDPVSKAAVWVNVISDNNQNLATTHTVNNNKPIVGSVIVDCTNLNGEKYSVSSITYAPSI